MLNPKFNSHFDALKEFINTHKTFVIKDLKDAHIFYRMGERANILNYFVDCNYLHYDPSPKDIDFKNYYFGTYTRLKPLEPNLTWDNLPDKNTELSFLSSLKLDGFIELDLREKYYVNAINYTLEDYPEYAKGVFGVKHKNQSIRYVDDIKQKNQSIRYVEGLAKRELIDERLTKQYDNIKEIVLDKADKLCVFKKRFPYNAKIQEDNDIYYAMTLPQNNINLGLKYLNNKLAAIILHSNIEPAQSLFILEVVLIPKELEEDYPDNIIAVYDNNIHDFKYVRIIRLS